MLFVLQMKIQKLSEHVNVHTTRRTALLKHHKNTQTPQETGRAGVHGECVCVGGGRETTTSELLFLGCCLYKWIWISKENGWMTEHSDSKLKIAQLHQKKKSKQMSQPLSYLK